MSKQVELDLNETGFLCNMVMQAFVKTDPPHDDEGNLLMPEWLYALYQKLSVANDEMLAELQKNAAMNPDPPLILLPDHFKRH